MCTQADASLSGSSIKYPFFWKTFSSSPGEGHVPLSRATCTAPRNQSSGFAVAGILVHFPCSRGLEPYMSSWPLYLYLGHRKTFWWVGVWRKNNVCLCHGPVALPEVPLFVLQLHHISILFQSLMQPQLHNGIFPKPSEIYYNLHSHRATILKTL